ncbi:MAG: hypothetical protein SGI91_04255 [Alphaproteobacteria bacterium]|jgi:hypothetical protein|nr:hypothetical protein [Alphaproteobacteria bacterium]
MIESVNNVASLDMMESRSRPAQAATDDDGFGFDDFLDIINPLQHLPVIGTAYRAITGDDIETPAKLAGGALFGGLFGFLGALGSTAYAEIVGESVDETLLSFFDSGAPKQADAARASAAYSSARLLID